MIFETRVQALFVALMLTGGSVPCFPGWPIKKIKLQGKCSGFDTDDLIIFVERPGDGQESKLLGQIKHSISITEGDKVFAEVIRAAWNDFSNGKIFTRGRDSIALITGPLSATDTSDVRTILQWARSFENSRELLTNVELGFFSNQAKRRKLKAFRMHLKKANSGNDVSDEDLFQFLKHFYLLGYDLAARAGVNLSFVLSLIGQYSRDNAGALWTQIIDEVQSKNQNAGTVTIDSLPDEIKDAFKKPVYERIPATLSRSLATVEKPDWNQHKYASELAIANLLGSWNEKSDADTAIVSKLAKEDYATWISKVRDILQQPESPVILKNGIWTVTQRKELSHALGPRLFDDNLDRFKQCVVTVLRERDPQFDLPSQERFAAGIYRKALKHSHHLRKGLAEGLALLGCYPNGLPHCSLGKAETNAVLAVREILDNVDWVLWGSLNKILPLLAEASPDAFLSAVETALRQTPCPFDELFSQVGKGIFGDNYLTGLLWALETLAWDERHLVRVSVNLGELGSHDPGGNWGNRPSSSLTTIFLPWFPQTTAPIEKRKVALQTLQTEFPKVAWKLLLSLLPNQHQTSSGSYKPVWRKTIPDGWTEKVTQGEYFDQVSFYANMAVEMAKHDIGKLDEMIDHLDNLPLPSFEKVLEYLLSEAIISKPENERLGLWTGLTEFASKHRRFFDAKWALSPDLISKIEDVARALAPHDRSNLHRRLFKVGDFDLFEEKGNWQEQRKKLEERRQQAVKEILDFEGIEAVVRFADAVESPHNVGLSLGFIAESGIDTAVLPKLLEAPTKNTAQFASGFVPGRYQSQGWTWVDKIDKTGWSPSQTGQFLAYLPFSAETWKRSRELLGENEVEYWSRANVNPYESVGDLSLAIDKLIEYGRPNAAIDCLYKIIDDKQSLDQARTVQSLLSAVTSTEPSYSMHTHQIIEIIKALQDDPNTNPDDLFRVEWAYLPLLDRHRGASPKSLESRLASDPGFFREVISLVYRSKKEPKSEKEPTEQKKDIATNAYRLLSEWRTPPGVQPDGGFSEGHLRKWLESVKEICTESGHIEVALTHLGKVLIYCPPDPGGLWINHAAAEALNARDAEEMRNGFQTAIFNSRGPHWVNPSGKPELELSAKYRKQAEDAENTGYQRLASSLRGLADSYANEARRIIDEHKQEGGRDEVK